MRFLILFFLFVNAQATIKDKMYKLYQNEEYAKACLVGAHHFHKYKKDEVYVSLYAFSCVKSDYIDRLAQAITALKFSQEARKNAAYFSTILMQKKLLYYSLVDGYKLSQFKLPTTDYVLSKVFDLYSKAEGKKQKKLYIFQDPDDSKLLYKLYVLKQQNINKIVIEEYYNTIKIKRHIYW